MTENVKKRSRLSEESLFKIEADVNELNDLVDKNDVLEKAFKKYHEISDTDSESRSSNEPDDDEKPLWHDPDDQSEYIDIQQFHKLRKLKKFGDDPNITRISAKDLQKRLAKYKNYKVDGSYWASQIKNDNASETSLDEDEASKVKRQYGINSLLKSSTKLLSYKNSRLPPESLHYHCLQDTNHFEHFPSAVSICRFLPKKKMAFAVARDNKLRIFSNVGTKKVENIRCVSFGKATIKAATPSVINGELYISGICGKRSLFKYNVEIGSVDVIRSLQLNKMYNNLHHYEVAPTDLNLFGVLADQGFTLLFDLRSNRITHKYKMNDFGRCMVFSLDSYSSGSRLYTGDDSGFIYEWDTRKRSCLRRFQDEGSNCVTALALSPYDDYLATGSKSGYVNMYDVGQFELKDHDTSLNSSVFIPKNNTSQDINFDGFKLVKSFGNLTTIVTQVKFHPSNQMVGIISSFAPDAFKMNFPRQEKSMNYPTVFDFNAAGDTMLVGTSHGIIKTYSFPQFTPKGSVQKIKKPKQRQREIL